MLDNFQEESALIGVDGVFYTLPKKLVKRNKILG